MVERAVMLTVSRVRVVRERATVVDGVDFTARAGDVLGVLGPNGAGKSSLLKAIAGVLPYEGEIAIQGVSAHGLHRSERARRIAYVPQQSELRAALSAYDVVAQGRYAHNIGRVRPSDGDHGKIMSALSRAEATPFASRDFTTLSQGEKQRVLIARALASEARVVLLDEPTAALDVGHALRLYRLLATLARDAYCVIVVLHPLQEAVEHTTEAILLDRGRLVAKGPTREVVCAERIEPLYGIELVPHGALGFRLPSDAPVRGAS